VLEDPSNTVPGWVVVCATSYPAAIRAADLVKVDWAAGDAVVEGMVYARRHRGASHHAEDA
jgi:hypothetical protein